MRKTLAAIALATAAICGTLAAQVPAEAWRIGPVINGRNYSVGMPPAMREGPQGPTFDFPAEGRGSVHYVSLGTRPIEGAHAITVRYRVDAAPGTRFVTQEYGQPGNVGISFQRRGDDWSARGRYDTYRWYSPTIDLLTPGVHTLTARLDDPRWISVGYHPASDNPAAFAAALANSESVSLTFGAEGGRGHGVYATGPARFTILDFRID